MKTTLKSLRFRDPKTGDECSIELGFDTLSILDDTIEFEVRGWYYHRRENFRAEESFTVLYDANDNCIYIKRFGEKDVAKINLEDRPYRNEQNTLPNDFEDLEGPQAFDAVCKLMDDSSELERIIKGIPAVDPIFGCIIKSGISTTVGQIVKCSKTVAKDSKLRRKIRDILKCLGVNKLSMLAQFTMRAIRCMLMAGWDIF